MRDTAYVNALAVSAQKSLLTKSKFLTMAEASSPEDALSVLKSSGFGEGAEISGAGEYEKLVDKEREKLRAFLREYSPCKGLIAYCYLGGDFFNLDAAARKVLLGADDAAYSPDGETSTELLEKYFGGEKVVLPDYLSATAIALKEACKNSPTGKTLSLITVKGKYAATLKTIKNRVIRDFIRTEIDCKNVSAYFRAKDKTTAEEQFIPGGKIKKEKLAAILYKDTSRTRNAFLFTPYYGIIDECLKAKENGEPFTKLEKLADDYPLKKIAGKKYEITGVTPMLVYYLYKNAELKNVRTVMSGKLASAPSSLITGRLREVYGE